MKLLQNKKIAYLTAIFCTLLWGTAFPFIKVGYSAFEIEESDIGSKLIFAGMRFMMAGFMVFLFLWISKRKPPTLSKRYSPVRSLGVVQNRIAVYFYIHRNRFYKRNEHLYNNGLCVVLYLLLVPSFLKTTGSR